LQSFLGGIQVLVVSNGIFWIHGGLKKYQNTDFIVKILVKWKFNSVKISFCLAFKVDKSE